MVAARGVQWKAALINVVIVDLIYTGTALAMTATGLLVSSSAIKIGVLRPIAAIPAHELELVAVGVALGVIAMAALRRLDLELAILPFTMVILLDADHLPSAFGIAQQIRPAHSLLFLAACLGVLVLARRPLEVEILAVAAFLGHIGTDKGVFPLFWPFSFAYYSTGQFGLLLVVGAGALAVVGGLVRREKRLSRGTEKSELRNSYIPMGRTETSFRPWRRRR